MLCCTVSTGMFVGILLGFVIFFFKQKTAYEMRISDWSSDVCSSDLCRMGAWTRVEQDPNKARLDSLSKRLGEIKKSQEAETAQIGRASCRERVCQYV